MFSLSLPFSLSAHFPHSWLNGGAERLEDGAKLLHETVLYTPAPFMEWVIDFPSPYPEAGKLENC